MKIKKVDRKHERDLLVGMIVDRNFLAQISSHYKEEYLKNSYAKTIAKWCLDYFEKYDEAPFNKIQDIFEYHDRKGEINDDDVDLIEKLLEQVNEDFQEGDGINTPFLLDKTEEYFNRVRIENLIQELEYELSEGNVAQADDAISNSREVKLTSNHAIDPLAEEEKIRDAFENVSEPLFTVGGHIGKMLNEQLCRDSFLGIQAPEKSGKTWLLYWLAREALKARKKVVIFQIGDMTENQSIVRMAIANAGKSNKMQYCGQFKYPLGFYATERDERECESAPKGYDLEYDMVDIEKPLCWRGAVKANEEFYKKNRLKKDKYLRLITTPANSINMKNIDAELEKLEREEDFVADVVIVDYMDILAAESPKDEGTRDRINNNWIQAKALCNKRHILLISATQADAGSYEGVLQSRANFSEDKRKYAHINGMLGLTQNDNEKRDGIIRLNWIMVREGEFLTSKPCYVAQSLRRGRPVVASLIAGMELEEQKPKKEKDEGKKKRRRDDRGRRGKRR